MQNRCDGAGPHAEGAVKKMPYGGGGSVILCRSCWANELRYRSNRNKELVNCELFDLPDWTTAKVYEV